jgi:hypothetical protein
MSAKRDARPLLGKVTLLATAIGALLGLRVGDAMAATYTVTNCLDDGSAGTLRGQILAVPSPGIDPAPAIDMTNLQCSTITLDQSLGQINVAYAVAINGPTSHVLDIAAAPCANQYQCENRVFRNNNTGILVIHDLSIGGGREALDGNASGGCIYSKGGVALYDVRLHDCTAYSATADARGGAVFAANNVALHRSTVSGSKAECGSGYCRGGGIYTQRNLTLAYSTLSFNQSSFTGGGAFASRGGLISSSTVSNNTAAYAAGLNFKIPQLYSSNYALTVKNSTISSNTATDTVSGLYSSAGFVTISNSTIVFNTVQNSSGAAGVKLSLYSTADSVTLQSTIISQNFASTTERDFDAVGGAPATFVTGADNLVGQTFGYPTVATSSACPLLGPLRDNGGLTLTHALLSGSPAIDAGNNTASLGYDQRGSAATNGTMDYARMSGTTDIGASEVQKDEIVFDAGFDGCAAPP